MTPDEQILICAVRYALGRMSYVVQDVCDYVKTKVGELSEECKNIMIKDIEEQLEFYHMAGHALGMGYDETQWVELHNILKEV